MASVTIRLVALLPPPAACRARSRLDYCNWTSALTSLSYSLDHIHAVNKSCFGVSPTWVDPGSGKVCGGELCSFLWGPIFSLRQLGTGRKHQVRHCLVGSYTGPSNGGLLLFLLMLRDRDLLSAK